jgi:hypothetical protein
MPMQQIPCDAACEVNPTEHLSRPLGPRREFNKNPPAQGTPTGLR